MISESFNLSNQILSLLEKNGITIATPVQKEIIPAVLEGKDVLAQSETGSGKTISFAIPIIEQLSQKDGIAALILVPTRELCIQITNEFLKFSKGKHLEITSVYGGVSIENQIKKLKKTSIIVATPGRLLDLLNRGTLKLDSIKYLVFDEADRMLDMGFIADIEKILKRMPQKRQTMLFSATVTKEIAKLSHKYLNDPIKVTLESEVKPEFLNQTYYKTTSEQKLKLLIYLLKHERDLTLVFCNRKRITDRLAKNLCAEGINAKCLHGDMTQGQRERVTSDFRNKKFNVLIATDVASRGLHIEDISHVYNYEIPKEVESYTHRVGRTARAGKKGEAISLVAGGEDQKFFKQILFNHNGVIKLKNIDPKVLPELKQKSPDHKKKNDSQGHSRDKHPHEIKKSGVVKDEEKKKKPFEHKPKQWREEKPHKPESINTNTDKWENEQPLTSEIAAPKPWGNNRPRTFGAKKSTHWKEKRPGKFGEHKSKHWDNNKPDKFGEKKSQHWKKNKTKTFGETNTDSSGERKFKPWEEKKPKLFNKVKAKLFKKHKDKSKDENTQRTWEERRPKFWSEKKAKTWRDSLQKMPGKQ